MDQINDLKQIQKTILEKLPESSDFVKTADGPGQFKDTGKIYRKIRLTELRFWTGRNPRAEEFDQQLILALDDLCKNGKLLIFNARYHPDLEFHDVVMTVEIGEGYKNFQGAGPPKIEIVKLYGQKPLTQKERQDRKAAIPEIKLELEKLKDARDKKFRDRFGSSGLAIESALHREEIEDEIALKKKLIEVVDEVGMLRKEVKNMAKKLDKK